jgi:hypothetical protein
MQILIRLSKTSGPSNWLTQSKILGLAIRPILEACVCGNMLYLRLHRNVPGIYASGVRYEEEPGFVFQGEPVEEFALIPIILARGFGDCDDLAPWRCAELRLSGEPAKIRIQWQRPKKPDGTLGRKYFHIVVRRGDGSIDDPSAKLGMHDGHVRP